MEGFGKAKMKHRVYDNTVNYNTLYRSLRKVNFHLLIGQQTYKAILAKLLFIHKHYFFSFKPYLSFNLSRAVRKAAFCVCQYVQPQKMGRGLERRGNLLSKYRK